MLEFDSLVAHKWRTQRAQLVKNHAKAPYVRLFGIRLVAAELRADVQRRSVEGGGHERRVTKLTADAQVSNLGSDALRSDSHATVAAEEQYVARLQVSMDDALLVYGGDPGAYLREDAPNFALLEEAPGLAPAVQQHSKVAQVRELNRQEEAAALVAEGSEAFRDVGMPQLLEELRLVLDLLLTAKLGRVLPLEDHAFTAATVHRHKNGAGAAAVELAPELVVSDVGRRRAHCCSHAAFAAVASAAHAAAVTSLPLWPGLITGDAVGGRSVDGGSASSTAAQQST
eukprot:COSAG05_NODE_1132_length_5773_cov_7.187346_3_plen_285_part_00